MASFTDTWNATFEALPPDVGEAINLGPDRIRDHKLAVRQRMEIDHKWDEAADPTHHGKHAKISWFEQASEPGNPDAGTAVSAGFAIPSDAEAGSGILTKDNGANEWRQGIDGGVNQLTDATHNFSATNAWEVGQLLIITPTAARTITLPTTEVGRGWFVDIMNLATTAPETNHVIVKSSDASEIRRVLPGQTVRFIATEGTPTTEAHWEFPGGLIYAASNLTTDETIYTIPANLIRAGGQGLRMSATIEPVNINTDTFQFLLGGLLWAGRIGDLQDGIYSCDAKAFWANLTTAQMFGSMQGALDGTAKVNTGSPINTGQRDAALTAGGTLAFAWNRQTNDTIVSQVTLELIK